MQKQVYFRIVLLLLFLMSVWSVCYAVLPEEPVNMEGEWTLTLDFNPGTGNHTALIKQDGENLTGIYKGQFLEGTLNGTVEGNSFDFTGVLRYNGKSTRFRFTGTVTGEKIKGPNQKYDFPITVDFSDIWSGSFTGERKKK